MKRHVARRAVRVIGPGRAGRSLLAAFDKAGWRATGAALGRDDDVHSAAAGAPEAAPGQASRPLGRDDDVREAAAGVDLLVIATPDRVVADVAASVAPVASTVVAHVAGSLTLDALAPHQRRASLHPLRSIADGSTDLAGAWFAVEGDELSREAVEAIGGRPITVTGSRAAYHAAAVVASNHVVALLGQVERIAATVGLPLDAFFDLVRGTVDNVELLGPAAALTGPVARGDWETVQSHLDALPEAERTAYLALAHQAARLTR